MIFEITQFLGVFGIGLLIGANTGLIYNLIHSHHI